MGKKQPDQSPEQKRLRRRKGFRRRVVGYGTLALLLYGTWVWQPYEFDFIPRKLPEPNPSIDPDSSPLFSPGTKVVVVTAHPDDSAFYIGGILTQLGRAGAEIHQIICTDGDKAYYGVFAEPESLRKVRRGEAVQELRTWQGRDVLFLGRPDGRLRADDGLIRRIRQRIDEVQPEYVICFDGDYPPRMSHQDHRRSGDAAALAAKGAPSVRWLVRFSTIAPNWVRDISLDWPAQENLLQIHKSQFHDKRLVGVTNMVEDQATRDGEIIGVSYAEGFRCIKLR